MRDSFADVNSITAGLNVAYVYVDEMEAPASAMDENGVRMILINRGFLEQVKDEVLRTVIERGLRVHEGLEIAFGEIPKRNRANEERKSLNKTFHHTLLNILGDVYIEAKGEMFYPAFSKYLSVMTGHLQELSIQGEPLKPKQKTELEKAIKELLKKAGVEVNPALIKTTHAFFEATRFGEVPKDLLDTNVEEDLQFIVPRVFLARRGGKTDDVIQASDEIYYYLEKKYGIPPELIVEIKVALPSGGLSRNCSNANSSTGNGREDEKGEKAEEGVGVLPWKNREQVERSLRAAVEESKAQLEKSRREGSAGGLLGGPDHAKLTPPTVRDAQFYLATVAKHKETILRLQALFKRLAGKRGFVPAREGDLNLKPSILQEAYVDSFKPNGGDERNYYLVMRHAIPDIDLVLTLDESGSTYGSATLFSEVSICILEAARRVGKIRIAAVSFGDGIRILKDFYEPVEAGRFFPSSGGGTPLGEALQQALQFRWRRGASIRRALVLATDGFPDSWEKVDKPIEELKRQRITPIALCIGIEANEDYRKRFEQVYEIKDASELTEAFIRTFLENALLKLRC